MTIKTANNIVIIGSGTGGTCAFKKIFSHLPDLNTSIVLVHHTSIHLNGCMTEWLDNLTEMDVGLAEENDELQEGKIYVAPIEKQLKIEDRTLRLVEPKNDEIQVTSIDNTMKSLSPEKRGGVQGIILSGIRHDGAEGLSHIAEIGGTTIVQSIPSAMISNMPKTALNSGKVDMVYTPREIISHLVESFKKKCDGELIPTYTRNKSYLRS